MFLAWQKFVRGGKRGQADVMTFERYLEKNLFELQHELKSGTYKHGEYETFPVYEPKERIISCAPVKDRVIHQALDNVLKFTFEIRYIYDSYACRLGKGIHRASYRLRRLLHQSSRSNRRTVYSLKCDIKNSSTLYLITKPFCNFSSDASRVLELWVYCNISLQALKKLLERAYPLVI